MQKVEKPTRKRIFSEEQKTELFKEKVSILENKVTLKVEEEKLNRIQFKTDLTTQYLLNCLCRKNKMRRDFLISEMIRAEAKKENIGISIHL